MATIICESISPTNHLNSTQCLRCLCKLENNIDCHCTQCTKCLLYSPVDKPHKCMKRKIICKSCNYVIISYSKKCLDCEYKVKKSVCIMCPLSFNDKKIPIYCSCSSNIVLGGTHINTKPKNLVLKYALGMEKSLMDIYLNTNQTMLFPHEFILTEKDQIMNEINPLIKKYFTTSAKINFYFTSKMQKLHEDATYEYSNTQISSEPHEFNPQYEGVTDNILSNIIDDLSEKWEKGSCEASGWSIHSLSECVSIITSHGKFMRSFKSNKFD